MNREQLLASLTAARNDIGGIYLEGDLNGRYLDWSCPLHANPADPETVTGRSLEVNDGQGGIAIVEMTWSEIERLQRALTLLLLERQS